MCDLVLYIKKTNPVFLDHLMKEHGLFKDAAYYSIRTIGINKVPLNQLVKLRNGLGDGLKIPSFLGPEIVGST
jgi:hypothetical protein